MAILQCIIHPLLKTDEDPVHTRPLSKLCTKNFMKGSLNLWSIFEKKYEWIPHSFCTNNSPAC